MSGYAYGEGAGRYAIFQVIDDKDPEEACRLKVQAVGYQTGGDIDKDHLPWARCMMPTHSAAMNGGVGVGGVGPMVNSYVIGFYADGAQQPIIVGVLGKSGKAGENGKLDYSGSDFPSGSRTDKTKGGDRRYDSDKRGYDDKSIPEYAVNDSPNPFNQSVSKDADGFTLGGTEYA